MQDIGLFNTFGEIITTSSQLEDVIGPDCTTVQLQRKTDFRENVFFK